MGNSFIYHLKVLALMSPKLRNAYIAFALFLASQVLFGEMSIAGIFIMAAFIGVVFLARRFPTFGTIGGGLLLLGSPLIAWSLYNPKFFNTEGSPAGLVLMLVFAIIIFFLMSLGWSMIKEALFPAPALSDDERADLAFEFMEDFNRSENMSEQSGNDISRR